MDIIGTRFDDQLFGVEGQTNNISGLSGNDTLVGASLADTFNGGPGDDTVFAGAGDDQAIGGIGNDVLFGEVGNDTLDGGLGDDLFNGGDGNDILLGGFGIDAFYGAEGDDQIYGGDGNDFMDGGAGEIFGYHGNDYLAGQVGDDYLVLNFGTAEGGVGNDVIVTNLHQGGYSVIDGGVGADRYVIQMGNEGGPGNAEVTLRDDDFLNIESFIFVPTTLESFTVASPQVFEVLDTNDDRFLDVADGQSWLGSVTADATGTGIVINILDDTVHVIGRQNVADFQMF